MLSKDRESVYVSGYSQIKEDLLYHYTTPNGLLSILKDMAFKLSSFKKDLDDPVDGEVISRIYFASKDDIKKDEIEKVVYRNRFICFVEDECVNNIICKGTNHSLMWYLYAQQHEGACIAFDRAKLMNKFSDMQLKFKFIDVTYGNHIADIYPFALNDLDFNSAKYERIFGSKHLDWSFQKEKRLMIHFSDINAIMDYIDISDTISHICLGKDFSSVTELYNLINDSANSRVYGKITGSSFSSITMEAGNITEGCLYGEFLKLKNI